MTQALFKARENALAPDRHRCIPALETSPRLTTAIFGLGGHDLQPRHLVAAFGVKIPGKTDMGDILASVSTDDGALEMASASRSMREGSVGRRSSMVSERTASKSSRRSFCVLYPLVVSR